MFIHELWALVFSLSHILEWSKDFEAAPGSLSSKRRTSEKLMISSIYILLESRGFRNFPCAPHDNGSFSIHPVWKEPVAKSYRAWFALRSMRRYNQAPQDLLNVCYLNVPYNRAHSARHPINFFSYDERKKIGLSISQNCAWLQTPTAWGLSFPVIFFILACHPVPIANVLVQAKW